MYKELFSDRHNSLSTAEEQEMVQMLGYNSIEQLISQTIPDEIRLEKELNLDEALTEVQLLEKLKNIGNKNIVAKSYKTILCLRFVQSV